MIGPTAEELLRRTCPLAVTGTAGSDLVVGHLLDVAEERLRGFRLVLLTDPRGLPLGYTLVPAGEKEYEPLADLLTGTPSEVVIADKGLWGRGYRERLAAAGVELVTPAKERSGANEARERRLASVRLAIESVFASLKGQMRLERHLAKTPAVSPSGSRSACSR